MSEPVGQKKARSRPPEELVESDSDSDEVEVEEMIIDESFWQQPRSSRRPNPTSREKIRKARLDRWAKNRMAHGKQVQDATVPADGSFSMRVDSDDTFPSQSTPWQAEENVKRKGQFVLLDSGRAFSFLHWFLGDSFPESDDDTDRMLYNRSPHRHKRARTSPPESRKGANQSHARHEKKRLDRLRHYAGLNRQSQQKKFTESVRFTFEVPGLSLCSILLNVC